MRFRRGLRRHTQAAFALLAAFAVLASLALGGHRYFYCALMDEVSLDSCCAPPSDRAQDDGPAIDRDACCTSEHFTAPAPGTSVAPTEPALRAPVVAVLPVPAPSAAPTRPAPASLARLARAGPTGPSPREHRLRSMVFLT